MKKTLTILAFITPLMLLVCMILHKRGTITYTGHVTSSNASVAKDIWKANHFIQITNSEDFDSQIEKAISTDDTYKELTAQQKRELVGELAAFYNTFTDGSISAYWSFRDPLTNGVFNAQAIYALRMLLSAQKPPIDTTAMNDKALVEYFSQSAAKGEIKDGKDGQISFVLCVDCFRSIAINAFKLYRQPTDKMPVKAGDIAIQEMNVGAAEAGSLMVLKPAPEEILKSGEKLIAVTVRTICQEKTKVEYEPLLITFYWSSSESKWLPYQIGQGTGSRNRAILLF